MIVPVRWEEGRERTFGAGHLRDHEGAVSNPSSSGPDRPDSQEAQSWVPRTVQGSWGARQRVGLGVGGGGELSACPRGGEGLEGPGRLWSWEPGCTG